MINNISSVDKDFKNPDRTSLVICGTSKVSDHGIMSCSSKIDTCSLNIKPGLGVLSREWCHTPSVCAEIRARLRRQRVRLSALLFVEIRLGSHDCFQHGGPVRNVLVKQHGALKQAHGNIFRTKHNLWSALPDFKVDLSLVFESSRNNGSIRVRFPTQQQTLVNKVWKFCLGLGHKLETTK